MTEIMKHYIQFSPQLFLDRYAVPCDRLLVVGEPLYTCVHLMMFVDSACPGSRLRSVHYLFKPFIQSVTMVVTSTVKEQLSECGARYGCPTGIGNDNFNYTVWMELMWAKNVDVKSYAYAPPYLY